jgi:hypothetical protein
MHQRLEEVLGDEPATTLMEHLPPTGWADLATKQDLAHVEEKLSARIDHLDDKWSVRFKVIEENMATQEGLADLRSEFHRTLLTGVFAMMATNAGILGLALTLMRGG